MCYENKWQKDVTFWVVKFQIAKMTQKYVIEICNENKWQKYVMKMCDILSYTISE